jgi:hypothetical protein
VRLDPGYVLTATLAGALLVEQLGKKPPEMVRVVVTLATAVSFAVAVYQAFQPDSLVTVNDVPTVPNWQPAGTLTY